MIKSNKEALATHLGWDMADLKEYEYQPGHYTRCVYSISDGIICATKDAKKLPQRTRTNHGKVIWVEVPDIYLNQYGWKIFKSTGEED